MNQKTTLIDHLRNEHRYQKYQTNEYAFKVQHRREQLAKLTQLIELFLAEQNRVLSHRPDRALVDEHDRQCQEFDDLSAEYERLQTENYLLRLRAKENIQTCAMLMPSSDR